MQNWNSDLELRSAFGGNPIITRATSYASDRLKKRQGGEEYKASTVHTLI
jgi:hypothetical protein